MEEELGSFLHDLRTRVEATRFALTEQHRQHQRAQEELAIGVGDEYADGTRRAGEAYRLAVARLEVANRTVELCAAVCQAAAANLKSKIPVEGTGAAEWLAEQLRKHK